MLNRELIDTFIVVARHRSISSAAELLYVSQSTVSHRIKLLENDLGISLLNRQRGLRNISLTKEGESFKSLALQWIELEANMQRLKSDEIKSELQIGTLASINEFLLSSFLVNISQNSNIRLCIRTHHTDELYHLLDLGVFDIAFSLYPAHYNNIVASPVFREPVKFITKPGSIYPSHPIDPSRLNIVNEVFLAWSPDIVQWHDYWFGPSKAFSVRVDTPSVLSSFLTDDTRWALCPASVATALEQEGKAEIHSFSENPPDRICYFLERKSVQGILSDTVRDFKLAFSSFFESHPWKYQ